MAPVEPPLEAGSHQRGLLLTILLSQLLDQCLAIFFILEALNFLSILNRILADLLVAFHAFPTKDGVVVGIAIQLTDFLNDFILRFFDSHEEAARSPLRHFLDYFLSLPLSRLPVLLPLLFDGQLPGQQLRFYFPALLGLFLLILIRSII